MKANAQAVALTALAAFLEVFASYEFRATGHAGLFLTDPMLWLAGLSFLAAPFAFLAALRCGDLSLVAPLLAVFNLLFAHVVGLVAFNEVLTPRQWAGQACLLFALVTFYYRKPEGAHGTVPGL